MLLRFLDHRQRQVDPDKVSVDTPDRGTHQAGAAAQVEDAQLAVGIAVRDEFGNALRHPILFERTDQMFVEPGSVLVKHAARHRFGLLLWRLATERGAQIEKLGSSGCRRKASGYLALCSIAVALFMSHHGQTVVRVDIVGVVGNGITEPRRASASFC